MKKSAAGRKLCTICGDYYNGHPQAFSAHLRKCKREKKEAEDLLDYENEVTNQALAMLGAPSMVVENPPDLRDYTIPKYDIDAQSDVPSMKLPSLQQSINSPSLLSPAPNSPTDESTAIPNSTTTTHIRTEYHTKSGKSARTCHINDPSFHTSLTLQPPPNHDPWSPFFAMCEDFLVLEFLLEAAVNADLANKLLAIFELCQAGKGRVMLSKFSQVKAAWEHASVQLTPVSPRLASQKRAHCLA
ncbi:hypothetical protein V8E53_000778 [Lactarius tabidus]